MHFRKFDIDLKIFLKENTNDTEKAHIQYDLEKPGKEYLLLLNYGHILRYKKKGRGGSEGKKVFQAISCFLT